MLDLLLRSRRAILPEGERPAAIGVRDGRVAAVLPYHAGVPARHTEDLGHDALLPGLVDTHVHVNEPGRTDWEGFATATTAAAKGGVTTIVDMPLNSLPPTVDVAALDAKRAAASGKCAVDVAFWGGAIPGNLAALAPLHEAGVRGFKCFLADSGVPEFPPLPDPEPVMAEIARLGSVLLVHAEDPAHLRPAPDSPRYRDFLASRPDRAEVDAIARVITLAERTGARVHVLHLSSADALPLLAAARARGVAVTAETCPHFLVLDADAVPDGGTEFKCCPPIRSSANRALLWDGLASGVIDCVVSDHSPATASLKLTGSFGTAWGGISSLQLGLPLVWTAARARGFTLSDVVGWMSAAPAALAGLDRGAIAVGAPADLVRFDPTAESSVDPLLLAHRNPVSPYTGRRLTGAVRTTWLSGIPVSGARRGRLLTPARIPT
ncbi:allantoinase [Actinorhabdospora filicis]|uniref:allantoinase n=1 Tax=Actinorhabdospora filicis TaxID=1785913 RepID=A0A9W6W916_9ACTN|nr:allantoinase AllB [Actinorhabdospora filicis]GLZ77558.1 allantoinase [Actinorhabdospora filicis]